MKYRISVALVLALLIAACAPRPEPAPVSSWGERVSSPAAMVRVARGDTLLGIAHRYNQPTRAIIEANHLVPPYRLEVGQSLIMPGSDHAMAAAPPPRYAARNAYPPPPPSPPPTPVSRPVAEAAPAPVTEAAPRIESPEVPPSNRPAPRVAQAFPERPAPAPPAAIKPATATFTPPPAGASPEEASARGFIWPVRGRVVEGYGTAANGTHNDGINIAAPSGSTVFAAKAGEVVYVGNELRGYGNLVLIKHDGGYLTAYAHNSVLLVHKGQRVARGQPIARVGATGQVGQPQLHFEIRAGRSPVNPTELLPPVQQASIGE